MIKQKQKTIVNMAMSSPSCILASAQVHPGSDGVIYVCVAITKETPTSENIPQLLNIIKEITTLDHPSIRVILDLRDAPVMDYLPHLSTILKLFSDNRSNIIKGIDMWLPSKYSYLEVLLRPIIDQVMCTSKLVLRYL